ncbi:hypothetical protein Cgig2_031924 [Carnegiea gigantea]|uniref:Uncharacterized protein n=1 Tax=Carnegiea gigantea TaxID=171969 RepID=A0A9Q1GIX4_9CARY|nr:hypothetical protein Cgig2_031924 [Carnegiea gigantea]
MDGGPREFTDNHPCPRGGDHRSRSKTKKNPKNRRKIRKMRDKACKSSKNRGEGVDKIWGKTHDKNTGIFFRDGFRAFAGLRPAFRALRPASRGCAQRPGAAPSVQGLRPASRTSGQRSQAAASVQELRPAFTGLRPSVLGTSASVHDDLRPQRFTRAGRPSRPGPSVQAFTGCGPAFTTSLLPASP